jgi:hypothetical protein
MLADLGYTNISLSYVRSIKMLIGKANAAASKTPNTPSQYSPAFMNAINVFEDRVGFSVAGAGGGASSNGGGSSSSEDKGKRSSLFGGMFSVKSLSISALAEGVVSGLASAATSAASGDEVSSVQKPPGSLYAAPAPSSYQLAGVSAPMNPSPAYAPAPAPPSMMSAPPESSVNNSRFYGDEPMNVQPFAATNSAPVSLAGVTQNQQHRAATLETSVAAKEHPKQESEASKKSPPTSTTTAAASKPKAVSGGDLKSNWLTGWIAKKMNPEAHVADVGGEMEAYYDKDLKRWVFPGEDPAEAAKPLAPPPIMPAAQAPASSFAGSGPPAGGPGGAAAAPPASSDPLASLMAPPPAKKAGARSRYADPLADMGRVAAPPASGAPPSGAPPFGGPPPSMGMPPAVFKPAVFKPAAGSEN